MGTVSRERGTDGRIAAAGTVHSRLRLHAADSHSDSDTDSDAHTGANAGARADSLQRSVSANADVPAMNVQALVHRAQAAQRDWATRPTGSRLKILRKLRLAIVADPQAFASTVPRTDIAETLAAEVLPLLDACRYLETESARILKENRTGRRGRPMWLWGNSVVLRPEPLGTVLIIGPSNYPLMLPGIQVLQALAAGNAVLIKPAAGCSKCVESLASLAMSVGLPPGLLQILPESPEAAVAAIQSGVNKVFLTGSAATGKAVRNQLADSGTPSVMELSGCDAVFVLDDADLNLVSDCLIFGLTLNRSQTCMAPRRVFVNQTQADQLLSLLKSKLVSITGKASPSGESFPAGSAFERHASLAMPRIHEAIDQGAVVAWGTQRENGELDLSRPIVLDDVIADMSVVQSDLFVPVVSLMRVESQSEMLEQNGKCPYALSATVFGPSEECQQFARQIPAGCIVINDMIVPSADPRVPFGGRGMSGDGTTRGEAGLLEMTQLKAIVTARRWFKPHLQQRTAADAAVLENLIRLEHAATPLDSLMTIPKMIKATIQQFKLRRSS